MANRFSWDTIESDYSAGEKSSLAANALRASGMFNELTDVGTNFFDKRGATAKANAENESASNTADIIEQIRSGKTPERTGFYDAGAIGNAKYAYEKDQIALGFKQRAEGRAAAAAGRARKGIGATSAYNAEIAKIIAGDLAPNGTGEQTIGDDGSISYAEATPAGVKEALMQAGNPGMSEVMPAEILRPNMPIYEQSAPVAQEPIIPQAITSDMPSPVIPTVSEVVGGTMPDIVPQAMPAAIPEPAAIVPEAVPEVEIGSETANGKTVVSDGVDANGVPKVKELQLSPADRTLYQSSLKTNKKSILASQKKIDRLKKIAGIQLSHGKNSTSVLNMIEKEEAKVIKVQEKMAKAYSTRTKTLDTKGAEDRIIYNNTKRNGSKFIPFGGNLTEPQAKMNDIYTEIEMLRAKPTSTSAMEISDALSRFKEQKALQAGITAKTKSNKMAKDLDESQKTVAPAYKDTKGFQNSVDWINKERKVAEKEEKNLQEKTEDYWTKKAAKINESNPNYTRKGNLSTALLGVIDKDRRKKEIRDARKTMMDETSTLLPNWMSGISKKEEEKREAKRKLKTIEFDKQLAALDEKISGPKLTTARDLKNKELTAASDKITGLTTGKSSIKDIAEEDVQEYVDKNPNSIKLKSPVELVDSLIAKYKKDGIKVTKTEIESMKEVARKQLNAARVAAAKKAEKKQEAADKEALRQKKRKEDNADRISVWEKTTGSKK